MGAYQINEDELDSILNTVPMVIAKAIEELRRLGIIPSNQTQSSNGELSQAPEPVLFILEDSADRLPRFGLRYFDDDGVLVAEGTYNPKHAAARFLGWSLNIYSSRFTAYQIMQSEVQEFVINGAAFMLAQMIGKMHRSLGKSMEFLEEAAQHDWASQLCKNEERYFRTQGKSVHYDKITEVRKELFQREATELRKIWGWGKGGSESQGTISDEQKIKLAQEYPAIFAHWSTLMKLFRERLNRTWRGYAKTPDFFDTPDDLLDQLESLSSTSKVSHLAIEHAGRRVGIYKESQLKPSDVSLRQQGIRATGYSHSRLETFRGEGESLLSQS